MTQATRSLQQDILDLIPSLRAYARSLSRSQTDAEDLVQETLVKAVGHVHQFRPGTNLRAWLFTIQRNTFYTRYHKERREPVVDVEEMPPLRSKPAQEWAYKLRQVDEAVGQLPVDQREALMLVGGAGMSYEEAAEVCGCALGTIKSRVSRARTRLLQILDYDSEREFLDERN